MLATQERVRKNGRTVLVWHKAADPDSCTGECDWHPIACSPTEGIVAPGPLKDVPLNLDEPGQRWCPDCLALTGSDVFAGHHEHCYIREGAHCSCGRMPSL